MCKLYIPAEALFLEEYANKHKHEEIGEVSINSWEKEFKPLNKDIYQQYVNFCKANGFSNEKTFQPSISKFNARCDELDIPHKIIKSNGINEFRFTPKDVYDHLLKKKWINRDENDPELIPEDLKGEDFVFEI